MRRIHAEIRGQFTLSKIESIDLDAIFPCEIIYKHGSEKHQLKLLSETQREPETLTARK